MNDFINQALLEPLELLGRHMLTVLPNVLRDGRYVVVIEATEKRVHLTASLRLRSRHAFRSRL